MRFACAPWMVSPLLVIGVNQWRIDVMEPGEEYRYGYDLSAKCIEIPHDVPNCAWDIEIDGESVFYATDCGSLYGVEAKDRDLYMVEGNYKEDELQERIREKSESGVFAYETRVEATHLSEEQALRFLAENAGPSSKYLLIHQHRG